MSGMFGGSSTPTLPPPVAPPVDNTELKNAAKLQAESLRKRKGMQSTWLTAGSGAFNEQTQKADLLGGGS